MLLFVDDNTLLSAHMLLLSLVTVANVLFAIELVGVLTADVVKEVSLLRE